MRFIANKLNAGDHDEYHEKSLDVRLDNHLDISETAIFLEVEIDDASDFASQVEVTAARVGHHRVLRATGPSVPNVLAAVLLAVRERTTCPRTSTSNGANERPARTRCGSCSPVKATSRR